ncbi:MAG: hypothetical protein ABII23_09445, partial [bacterium]
MRQKKYFIGLQSFKKIVSFAVSISLSFSAVPSAAVARMFLAPPGAQNIGGLLTGSETSSTEETVVFSKIAQLTGKDIAQVIYEVNILSGAKKIPDALLEILTFITQQVEMEDKGKILADLGLDNAIKLLIAISINAYQARATKVSFSPTANIRKITDSLRYITEETGIDFAKLSRNESIPDSVAGILAKDRFVRYETESLAGLRTDISKALAAQVGDMNGVTPHQLNKITERLTEIQTEIESPENKKELAFLNLPEGNDLTEEIGVIMNEAYKFKDCEDVIIINGESVGATAAIQALTDPMRNQLSREQRGGPRIHSLDTADEDGIQELLAAIKKLNPSYKGDKTGIIVISPNYEDDSITRAVYERVQEEIQSSKKFIITDKESEPVKAFEHYAQLDTQGLSGFFTYAGLLPLAIAGVDIRELIDGAKTVDSKKSDTPDPLSTRDPLSNFAYISPAVYYLLSQPRQKGAEGDVHVKNLVELLMYSEMGKGLGQVFADALNASLIGNELMVDSANGTKFQHFTLQALQKAHSVFLTHTFGFRGADHNMTIGRTADPSYAGLPMTEVYNACRQGVREAMQAGNRPNLDTSLEKLDPRNLGMLIRLVQIESVVLARLFESPLNQKNKETAILNEQAKALKTADLPEEQDKAYEAHTPGGIKLTWDKVLQGKGSGKGRLSNEDGVTEEEFDNLLLDLLRIQGELQKESNTEHSWMGVPEVMKDRVSELKTQAGEFTESVDDIVVVGVGGSSAGGIAGMDVFLDRYFNLLSNTDRNNCPRVTFLGDNIDPDQAHHVLNHLNPEKTGIIVVSKSGVTAESNIMFATIRENFEDQGMENFADHVCVVTDLVDGILIKEARSEGYQVVAHPEKVGGRWTLLTEVAAFLFATQDIDLDLFYQAGKRFIDTCYGIDKKKIEKLSESLKTALNDRDISALKKARAEALEIVKQNP